MWVFVAPTALANPCDDTLELLGRGVPAAAVTEVVRTDTWDADGVACLDQAGAPRRVVVAAARTASIAAPPDERPRRWELAVGSGWIPDRGIATEATADLGVTWFPVDLLGIGVDGSLGVNPQPESRRSSRQQVLDDPESWSIRDLVSMSGTLTAEFVPFQGELHTRRATMGLGGFLLAGTGLIVTEDDPVAFEPVAESEPFRATAVQTHPVLVVGGGVRIAMSPALGLRLQADQARWIEVYEATMTQSNHRSSLSAALTVRPTRR